MSKRNQKIKQTFRRLWAEHLESKRERLIWGEARSLVLEQEKQRQARRAGQDLEDSLSAFFGVLLMRGEAKIHKVDPPTRTVGRSGATRIIHLANPFVDYIGVVPGVGSVVFEAKRTENNSLSFGERGLHEKQRRILADWARFVSVAGVITLDASKTVRIAPAGQILAHADSGAASIPLEHPAWRVVNMDPTETSHFLDAVKALATGVPV